MKKRSRGGGGQGVPSKGLMIFMIPCTAPSELPEVLVSPALLPHSLSLTVSAKAWKTGASRRGCSVTWHSWALPAHNDASTAKPELLVVLNVELFPWPRSLRALLPEGLRKVARLSQCAPLSESDKLRNKTQGSLPEAT